MKLNFTTLPTISLFVILLCSCSIKPTEVKTSSSDIKETTFVEQPTKVASTTFDYEGNETNELGERHFYVLKIRKDFSAASLGNDNSQFFPLELLSTTSGLYQFIGGTIIGIKIQPSTNSCNIYNFDGSLFCVLSRRKQ